MWLNSQLAYLSVYAPAAAFFLSIAPLYSARFRKSPRRVAVAAVIALAASILVSAQFGEWIASKSQVVMAGAERKPVQAEPSAPAASSAGLGTREDRVCVLAFADVTATGIIPSYAKLTGSPGRRTAVPDRYTCGAETSVTKYDITVDMICSDFQNKQCAKVFQVSIDDGTVLYHR
ncbi:MAG: hypothetical protein HY243_15200 [Proteobacteria bacterium]|nr:hypothetical protein [Pseudomonadota bacterium]